MTFAHRVIHRLLIASGAFAFAAFTPLDVHIGDSVAQVDAVLGKKFEKTPAMKMTHATRLYERPDGKVYVAFKDQKLCLLYYVRPFTEAEAFAILTREAPAEQWKLDRTDGTMRFYHTLDSRSTPSAR